MSMSRVTDQWVEQIAVVTFDLLHGPVLVGSVGRDILKSKSPQLFHAFPEGHGTLNVAAAAAFSGCDFVQSAQYFFTIRPDALETSGSTYHGFVFHRQIHSTDLQRNSDRRSIILVTKVVGLLLL